MGCCCADDDAPAPAPRTRGCTDLPCLLVFVVVWCAIVFLAALAFAYGRPALLAGGYDSFGNVCGVANSAIAGVPLSGRDMRQRPLLFLQDAAQPARALALCVSRCPPHRLDTIADVNAFFAASGSQLCRYDYARAAYNFSGLVAAAAPGLPVFPECPPLPVPASEPLLGHCIPTPAAGIDDTAVSNLFGRLNGGGLARQVAADVRAAWRQILLAGTALLWWTYASLRWELDATPPQRILRAAALNEHALLVCAIVATVVTPLLLAAVVFSWRQLRLLAELFDEAAACLRALPCLLLQPLWTALAEAALLAFGALLLVWLGSASHIEPPGDAADAGEPERVLRLAAEVWVPYVWWLVPVVLVWTAEFLLACQWLVTAGAVCRWYFSRAGARPACPIASSLGLLLCHHLGTAALGSFLVSLLRLPRAVLAWLSKRVDACNGTCACCAAACACCLCCWERCVRCISHNAYAVTAIDGSGFCAAARAALAAITANAGAAAAVNGAGDLALFCGKLAVTATVAAAAVLCLRSDPDLHFYAAPCVVATLAAYLIADCVLSAFETVVDTLFLCYCQDVAGDTVDGGVMFAPPRLARVMADLGAAPAGEPEVKRPLREEELRLSPPPTETAL
ncbi:choline transporter-like 1 [Pollicipes pollicipes]|uniref:choline transporter-like 1 n=1 Tax=Pollicipes pollicipes TaxID=41117 RepID=UPI00188574A0|nr:choline transporter-like 1 [Pollicipes pollicipes]